MLSLLLGGLVGCSDVTLSRVDDPGADEHEVVDLWGTPTLDAEEPVMGSPAVDVVPVECVVDLTFYGEGVTSEGSWEGGAFDVRLDWAEGSLETCPGMRYTGPATLAFTRVDDVWYLDLEQIVIGGPDSLMEVTLIQPANLGMEVTTAVTMGMPGWNARIDVVSLEGTEWGPGYKVSGAASYQL